MFASIWYKAFDNFFKRGFNGTEKYFIVRGQSSVIFSELLGSISH